MTQLARVINLMSAAGGTNGLVVVGIGGHGASGKSTLAAKLASMLDGVQVIPTDAFWNGSSFDLARLRTEVLDVLLAGETASYDAWDWASASAAGRRLVEPTGVVIIDGVCALHEMFRADLDVRIWVDTPADIRLERGVARDGEASRSRWVDVWMPNEARYVAHDRPIECAHIIIDGTADF
jgi:uridine kinase